MVDDNNVSPMLARIEARVVMRCGSRVRCLTEKAAASRTESPVREVAPQVKNRPITRGSQEGGNRGTPTDTPTATNVPGTPTSNREVSNTLEDNDQRQEHIDTLLLLTQSNLGVDFLSELRGAYDKDPMFRVILEKPNEYRNFEVDDRLIYLKESERRVLCIPRALIQGRSAREINISEAHSLLAHLGADKTLDYLRDNVWWKDIITNVKAFCETCKMSKPSNQKPYGLLNPLGIPSYPWESVGIDFVGPLPESCNRDGQFDSLTVVICLLTAMVHLIPSHTNYMFFLGMTIVDVPASRVSLRAHLQNSWPTKEYH